MRLWFPYGTYTTSQSGVTQEASHTDADYNHDAGGGGGDVDGKDDGGDEEGDDCHFLSSQFSVHFTSSLVLWAPELIVSMCMNVNERLVSFFLQQSSRSPSAGCCWSHVRSCQCWPLPATF